MTHHRDTGACDGGDLFSLTDPSLQFHGMGSRFCEEASIGKRDFGIGVSINREVSDHKCILHSPGYRSGVMNHVIEGHMGGVGKAKNDHTEGIADQKKVDAHFIKQAGGRVIVSRERGNRRAAFSGSQALGFFGRAHS